MEKTKHTEERGDEKGYNGWKNYQTWNVALWIQNDEGLYAVARECKDYEDFRGQMRDLYWDRSEKDGADHISVETPDNVAWNDSGLDIPRLDELIKELKGE